eukprot:11197724-Lingulodinium_polyedra.AAC.1
MRVTHFAARAETTARAFLAEQHQSSTHTTPNKRLGVAWVLFGCCFDAAWALFGCCLGAAWTVLGCCFGA